MQQYLMPFQYTDEIQFTKYLTIYHKFIVRLTYNSDLQRGKISLKNIVR